MRFSAGGTLALLGALILVAGCGQESSTPSASDEPSVLPPPAATASPSDYVAPIETMGADGLQEATTKAMSVPAFEQAMASYCTDYYTSQRDDEERYGEPNSKSRTAFARATAADARRTERQLQQLSPPEKLADAFAKFVDNAHRISEDREAMLRSTQATGEDGQAGDDYEDAVIERRPLASQLHAPLCDGKLPASQATAAVAAAREWATDQDPVSACRDLVTPWFPYTQESCVHIRTMAARPPYALPDDIAVQSLTGVEELAATVNYLKIGGCGCSPDGYVRLFFLDGEWKVNDAG